MSAEVVYVTQLVVWSYQFLSTSTRAELHASCESGKRPGMAVLAKEFRMNFFCDRESASEARKKRVAEIKIDNFILAA